MNTYIMSRDSHSHILLYLYITPLYMYPHKSTPKVKNQPKLPSNPVTKYLINI